MSFPRLHGSSVLGKPFEIQAWGDQSSDSKPVTDDQITIGVELEAYLYGLDPQDIELKQLKTYESVASALQPLAKKLGTRANIISMNDEHDHKAYKTFQIKEDASIDPSIDNYLSGDEILGIEIATPILRNTSWKWVIPEMTQILKPSFKLGFNSSTGLHVHVGIGRPYNLQDLRRISKAIVLFEKQMDTYHHASRRNAGGPKSELNFWILSCRDYSLPLKSLSNTEMMKKIDMATDHKDEKIGLDQLLRTVNSTPGPELSKMFDRHFSHSFRGYRYNLISVKDIGTIEFRQAIATSDGKHTVDWIGRVIKFVTNAIATSDEMFCNWARYGISDPEIYCRFGVPPPVGLEGKTARRKSPQGRSYTRNHHQLLRGLKLIQLGAI